MSARRRINRLRGRTGFRPDPRPGEASEATDAGGDVREVDAVRELDREIANLQREVEAAEARMSPAELAASRAAWAEGSAALKERMHGLTLEEQIAVLEVELEKAEGGDGDT